MKWGEVSILGRKIMYFNRILSIYIRASEISQRAERIETQDFNGNLRVGVIVPFYEPANRPLLLNISGIIIN